MALFSEYAVTPDVFDESCYGSSDLCDVHIRQLQKVFLSEGIVRDLRDGEWQRCFSTSMVPWHPEVKNILKNLTIKGRLASSVPELPHIPQNNREWCKEALDSHKTLSLNGIIVSNNTKSAYRKESLVESVEKLSSSTKCTWWPPKNSIRLKRNINDYKNSLKLILRHARSIMFIDPHIDPSKEHYRDFIQLIKEIGNRPSKPPPLIEIHRKILRGSGRNGPLWDEEDMKTAFCNKFGSALSQLNLKVNVFAWDDFHDRYLISNLGGISMPNGFDTSKSNSRTTWSRLDQSDRDDIQREFTPGSRSQEHKNHFSFTIP